MGFAQPRRRDGELSRRGGVTPDHVIRTKRVPMVGRDVAALCRGIIRSMFDFTRRSVAGRGGSRASQVILDPDMGMGVLGRSADDVGIAEDIYRHTIDIIMGAEKLGGWRALPAKDF